VSSVFKNVQKSSLKLRRRTKEVCFSRIAIEKLEGKEGES